MTNNEAEVRYRIGKVIEPTQKTYEMALDRELYANEVAKKYSINFRGSGQDITIKYNPELRTGIYGRTLKNNPTVIEIGDYALQDEEQLANTITHELNHARDFLKGGNAPEETAYKAGDT